MAVAYSREQIDQFLHHVGLPENLHHAPPTLELLEQLHVHMLAAVPYENLAIHYNPTHSVVLEPQHLFNKVVTNKRGRGGYCMEVAILYNHILRGLGFDAYTAGARTRPRLEGVPHGEFPGWVHIVNIVTFPDGSKYHDDVGFGGDGAIRPMPLIDGEIQHNIGAQQIRLVRDWLPRQVHRTEASKQWIYQYRNGVDKEWNSFYSFVELEFLAPDWEVVNLWTSTKSPESWQTYVLLAIRFLRRPKQDGSEGQEIYGKRMLVQGVIKENLGGKTQLVHECKDEVDRVKWLDEFFEMKLSNEEKLAIHGYITELK